MYSNQVLKDQTLQIIIVVYLTLFLLIIDFL